MPLTDRAASGDAATFALKQSIGLSERGVVLQK
jgi:hypothetical protein